MRRDRSWEEAKWLQWQSTKVGGHECLRVPMLLWISSGFLVLVPGDIAVLGFLLFPQSSGVWLFRGPWGVALWLCFLCFYFHKYPNCIPCPLAWINDGIATSCIQECPPHMWESLCVSCVISLGSLLFPPQFRGCISVCTWTQITRTLHFVFFVPFSHTKKAEVLLTIWSEVIRRDLQDCLEEGAHLFLMPYGE